MLDVLQRGGWSAQLVFALGLFVTALVVAHYRARRTSFLPLIFGFGAAMIFVGLLGISLGLMDVMAAFNVADAARAQDQWSVAAGHAVFTALFAFHFGAALTVATCTVELLRRRRGERHVA